MFFSILGRKVGMTSVFDNNGNFLPISVIDISYNRIIYIRDFKKFGYFLVQVAFGIKKKKVNKSLIGHYFKSNSNVGLILKEFKFDYKFFIKMKFKVGDFLNEKLFKINNKLDIKGVSIGKGFSGTIKRHNFSSGRASHGNSKAHRLPGSIGMCQDPGRVFPGKLMAGHLGNKSCTIKNIKIYKIDNNLHLLMLIGSIPGFKNNYLTISKSLK